jgi:hypothetical protein
MCKKYTRREVPQRTGSNPVLTARSVNPQVLGNENCQMSPSKLMTPRKDEDIVRWRNG